MARLLGVACLWLWAVAILMVPAYAAQEKRPNIVFILVDDQETLMNSIDFMPTVQNQLIKKGTTFKKHYCTVAVCCPSRVNIWTGQMAHNTNVTALGPPFGGYPTFMKNGLNDRHLAVWMKESGYNTYYVGKLFNYHNTQNYNRPPMKGYTGSEFFLEPYTYQYFNVSSTRNGNKPHHPRGYSTDIVSRMSRNFLKEGMQDSDKPFFLTIAPIAPHSYYNAGKKVPAGPAVPAPRHRGMFEGEKIPRTKNFNPDTPSGVSWVSKLPKLTDREVKRLDRSHVRRLQALQAVDEMVGDVIDDLDKGGVLDNTYIIYSSDNGFHLGQHRLKGGKELGFETDINVPFIVRGPDVPKGKVRTKPTSHTDIAPTIMKLAGNDIDDKQFDGQPINVWEESSDRAEHVAVEFWNAKITDTYNNTYKGLRIEAEKYGFYYSVWCTNEKELYDMREDDQQMDNLMANKSRMSNTLLFGQSISAVADRLDSLVMVTKTCKGSSCTHPWKTLHPDGSVKSLEDALDKRYDEFYRNQIRVSFTGCKKGQLREFEGAQVSDLQVWKNKPSGKGDKGGGGKGGDDDGKGSDDSDGDESAASRLRGMAINPFWYWGE